MKKIIVFVFLFLLISTSQSKGGNNMKITSPDFTDNTPIPKEFTCLGEDVNPALNIEGTPKDAKSLALIVDDPDAPSGMWVHWVVFNIPPSTTTIHKNSIPGSQGRNDFNRQNYGGPCPPSGTHHYHFKIYALDTMLNLQEKISKKDLEFAMKGHILDQSELTGLFKK